MIRKILVAATFIVLIGSAYSAPKKVGNNWKNTVRIGDCTQDTTPVVDITREVENRKDISSEGPWADINYTKNIKVWKLADQRYCAVVEYDGECEAVKGATAPGGETQLTGEEHGKMQGGYRAMITGSEIVESGSGGEGTLESVSGDCTQGNCDSVDWVDGYFSSSPQVSYEWWAWVYNAGECGSWTNAESGNSGRIICE